MRFELMLLSWKDSVLTTRRKGLFKKNIQIWWNVWRGTWTLKFWSLNPTHLPILLFKLTKLSRNGIEPLTSRFSVSRSNRLSYLNFYKFRSKRTRTFASWYQKPLPYQLGYTPCIKKGRFLINEPTGTWTLNLMIKSHPLCRLSYGFSHLQKTLF